MSAEPQQVDEDAPQLKGLREALRVATQRNAPAFAHAFGHPDTWAGLIIGAFGAGAVGAAIATAQLQLEVDESQRGRIMAPWSVAFLGLRPVASLADGAIAGAFGVRVAGVVLALPAFAAAALIYNRVPATPSAPSR